jgi:hypothetical protein
LLLLLTTFQAFDWLGETPQEFSPVMAVMALLSYSLASLAAWWVGRGRSLRDHAHESAATL